MSPSQRADAEKHGVDVLPELDPVAAYYAEAWSTLRASTPPDHPVSIVSIVELLGRDALRGTLPLIQAMDRRLFEGQRERMERERKEAERKAKARRGGGRR